MILSLKIKNLGITLKFLRGSNLNIPETNNRSRQSEQRVGAAPLRGGDWGGGGAVTGQMLLRESCSPPRRGAAPTDGTLGCNIAKPETDTILVSGFQLYMSEIAILLYTLYLL